VTFLERNGWKIEAAADTASKQRGVDIHASKGEQCLLVEAKGYPSKAYRDPSRASEQKPTNPTNQAQHWYSHALLKAMRLQTKHPDATIAIALPDFPRYRTLFDETKSGLAKLGIGLITVDGGGDVRTWGFSASQFGEAGPSASLDSP